MAREKKGRRARSRSNQRFPAGMFTGLLTAAFVVLVGVFLRQSPLVILIRSSVSAVLLGCIVSLGLSVVRIADSEQEKQRKLGRQ